MTDARFDAFNRATLVDGAGQLRVSFANRGALYTWDSPLRIDRVIRVALVSNTTSGAATTLLIGSLVRIALVAEAGPPSTGPLQTAVAMV